MTTAAQDSYGSLRALAGRLQSNWPRQPPRQGAFGCRAWYPTVTAIKDAVLVCWVLVILTNIPGVFGQADSFSNASPPQGFDQLIVGDTIYRNVRVTKAYPDRIAIAHDRGIALLFLKDLSPEVKTQFGFDPVMECAYEQDRSMKQMIAAGRISKTASRSLFAKRVKDALLEHLGWQIDAILLSQSSVRFHTLVVDGPIMMRW